AAGAPAAATAAAPAAAAVTEVDTAPQLLTGAGYPETVSVFFDTGAAALPADAKAQLEKLAEWAKANASGKLGLSGYHDASGDPAVNAQLAKQRALAARAALVESGVGEGQLVMVRPQQAEAGAADDRMARRVDVYPAQ
ncbi:OmpA family protein, partial [Quisquiliibacterium transsilvanicum]